MADVIVPELKSGTTVICDRFADSTMAYQGYGGNLNLDRLRHANELATNEVVPDLTVLLDVTPETGLQRRDTEDQSNGETQRRFEELPIRFHRNVPTRIHTASHPASQTDGSESMHPQTPTKSPIKSGNTSPNSSF